MRPITPGAARSYVDVELEGDPQPARIPKAPETHPAELKPIIMFQRDRFATPEERQVYLKRQDNAPWAYELQEQPYTKKNERKIILHAIAYARVGDNFVHRFSQRVVIKELARANKDKHNCPYKEVAWLQRLGDNRHLIKPLEVLYDEKNLYLILPSGIPLHQCIPFNQPDPLPPDVIQTTYYKLLKILHYLERRKLCHRDLKPHNLVVLTGNGWNKDEIVRNPEVIWRRLVAIDTGISYGIPINPTTKNRYLIEPHGVFGTHYWLCPELFRNAAYDGVFSDFWAVSMILYNLLTNQMYLYSRATPTDILFLFFVIGRSVSMEPWTELQQEIAELGYAEDEDTDDEDLSYLTRNRLRHLRIVSRRLHAVRPEVRNFLANQLHLHPSDRLTLAEAIASTALDGGTHL